VAKKGTSTRRGTINVALNGLVAAGVIAGFRTNYQTKDEPDRLGSRSTRGATLTPSVRKFSTPWPRLPKVPRSSSSRPKDHRR
jgi:hypothetical protein